MLGHAIGSMAPEDLPDRSLKTVDTACGRMASVHHWKAARNVDYAAASDSLVQF